MISKNVITPTIHLNVCKRNEECKQFSFLSYQSPITNISKKVYFKDIYFLYWTYIRNILCNVVNFKDMMPIMACAKDKCEYRKFRKKWLWMTTSTTVYSFKESDSDSPITEFPNFTLFMDSLYSNYLLMKLQLKYL